jgi:hypothetical protein
MVKQQATRPGYGKLRIVSISTLVGINLLYNAGRIKRITVSFSSVP